MTPKSLGNPSFARCSDQSSAEPCGSALALARPLSREMQRKRRLPDAAFLIEERDDHGRAPRLAGRLALLRGRES